MLDLDLWPRSSWTEHGMKIVRALSVGFWREGGHGKWDSRRVLEAFETAVWRRSP